MVFNEIKQLLMSQYACGDMEIEIDTTLDELNLSRSDLSDLAISLEELYGVEISGEIVAGFYTVEDIVEYIEDTM